MPCNFLNNYYVIRSRRPLQTCTLVVDDVLGQKKIPLLIEVTSRRVWVVACEREELQRGPISAQKLEL